MNIEVPVRDSTAPLDGMVRRLHLRALQRGWPVVLVVADGVDPGPAEHLAEHLAGVSWAPSGSLRPYAPRVVVEVGTLDLDAALAAGAAPVAA